MEEWLRKAYQKLEKMPEEAKQIRETALNDLYFFAKLCNPGYMYGDIHKDIFKWMEQYNLYGKGEEYSNNKLIMLPRAHLKSHMVATWCAWVITRHPEVTILYVSATAELAETQLFAVQNILGSTTYQRYFPEYINPQEGLREKWSMRKMSIDHIKRKEEGIRDATIATAGLTTNTTYCFLTHLDELMADTRGTVSLAIPPELYDTPVQCTNLEVPGLPGPDPG